MKTRLYTLIESTGVFLSALGFLILTVQLAGYWRYGSMDPWAQAVLQHGTLEQVGALAYLVLVLVLLSCREGR
jgi:hypothetical protein